MSDKKAEPSKSQKTDNVLEQATIDEVIRLKTEVGLGTRRIAFKTGLSRKKVRTLLAKLGLSHMPQAKKPKASKLDPFRQEITEKAQQGLTGTRILREIRQKGYQGGQSILNEFIRSLPNYKTRAPRKRVWRRFETSPGQEMQVDWSPYRIDIADRLLVVHAFAATLGYSRKTFVYFFLSEKLSCLLEAHTMAFDYFEGVTARCVYDNMATVVLGSVGKEGKPLYNPRFLEFAEHYGFKIFLCRVKDPDRKGKDERFFSYLENDFLRDSTFESMDDLNARARIWLDEIANPRKHGTTGRIPDEVWREEKRLLLALPDRHFGVYEQASRLVGPDAVISINGTPYTIPASLATAREVQVRLFAERFEVLDKHHKVAWARRYVDTKEKGKLQIEPVHYDEPPARRPFQRRRFDDLLLERFASLIPLVDGLRLRFNNLAHIHLKQLWTLASRYGDVRFLEVAHEVQDARRFDAFAVRRLLERRYPIDDEPQPPTPLTSEARIMLELGDVESGSMDDYAHLDAKKPTGEGHGQEEK